MPLSLNKSTGRIIHMKNISTYRFIFIQIKAYFHYACFPRRLVLKQRHKVIRKWWNRELTLKCKLKCYVKPIKDPLGVSPSKGNQGTTRGKEKILLTSVGIEPTTSGLDLPLLCRLSYEVGQRKSGTIEVVRGSSLYQI